MVGTTRFELATSPTPRVRSTRLSHVPTCCLHVSPSGRPAGYPCRFKCTRTARSAAQSRGRCDILLRQRAAFAKEKLVHLLHQKLLRLTRPWLETVLIQQ